MSETVPSWPVPDIDDLTLAFPAEALSWMPPEADIPEEFHDLNDFGPLGRGPVECRIAHQWFYRGLPATVEFHAREGVDPEKAVRAVKATLGSYAPKHEHKLRAVAFMLRCWFERIEKWENASES